MEKKGFLRSLFLSSGLFILMFFLFQNCGPAKVGTFTEDLGSFAVGTYAEVGEKVDLDALLKSTPEDVNNVLYPSTVSINSVSYTDGLPIIENVVLRKNDFTKIIWVHAPTATIVAVGDALNGRNYSPNSAGLYYVIGFRSSKTYLITQFMVSSNSNSMMSVSAAGAVQVSQNLIYTDTLNEFYYIQVAAPNVELKSSEFVLQPSGVSLGNRRAYLLQKKYSEEVNVKLNLIDKGGATYSQTLNFPSKTAPTPTPTPTPANLPDLVILSMGMDKQAPVDGDYIIFSAVIKNQGNVATPANTVLHVLFQIDGQTVAWSDNYKDSIPPGGVVTVYVTNSPVNVAGWLAHPGSYNVVGWVNDKSEINESDIGNNQTSLRISVGSP